MNIIQKMYRFCWRFLLNSICLTSAGRNWLYPQQKLASRFGRGDVEYAWQVFLRHFRLLQRNGFDCAQRVLEVGPGRNLGTALLWWCYLSARTNISVEIVCWDVFKNAAPEDADFWPALAHELSENKPQDGEAMLVEVLSTIDPRLATIARGDTSPSITYRVMSMDDLANQRGGFDLIYSQAAIEHVWHIDAFWDAMGRLTAPSGWHSHRIDLADHGRRETNYIEMLEWSSAAYWMTMRFVPGAINRWRAGKHLRKIESLEMRVMYVNREMREFLPIPVENLASEFRDVGDEELRTTALDVVAVAQ